MLIIAVALFALQCGQDPVSEGGGASETVAKVVPWGNTIKIVVESDEPFSVTAQVCSDSFTLDDTGYFHMEMGLTESSPEWIVPGYNTSSSTIIISNNADGTAALISYGNVFISDPPSKRSTLAGTGAVSGTVSKEASGGNTVPAGGVRLFIKGTFFEAVSDSAGHYRIDNVPAGTYMLDVSKNYRSYNKTNESMTVDISGDTTVIRDLKIRNN